MLYLVSSEKMNEHDDDLLIVDTHYDKGLILTVCRQGVVKVWNQKKELIRQIKFNEDIKSALFLNKEPDIVVAHRGQLSVIRAEDY